MSQNYFRAWLKEDRNREFWLQRLASRRIDAIISDPQIQKSIANSRTNQLRLSAIESKITSDYALLIDSKLREIYSQFPSEDFERSSGFEGKNKSNLLQQSYFETRGHIEYFLKSEIKLNSRGPDAQLNAFIRWINIADLLLRRHCYEGFLLVVVNLDLISNETLVNGLPDSLRDRFNRLCALKSPDRNHTALKNYIKEHQNSRDFTPLFLNYHPILILNESLALLLEKKKKAAKDQKRIIASISELENREGPDLIALMQYRLSKNLNLPAKHHRQRSFFTELRTILEEQETNESYLLRLNEEMAHQIKLREDILLTIEREQKASYAPLPLYLNQTYNLIAKEHKKYIMQDASNIVSNNSPGVDNTPSTLYSSKLLPGFWNRHRKLVETYWEGFFIPSVFNR